MKLVFFGSSKYVLPVIEKLRDNFELTLVVTTERLTTDAISAYCLKHKIPYFRTSSLSDPNLKSLILGLNSSIGVVADFGLIIPKPILDIFPKGILNIHPSLLPKYRGPTPVQSAILNGDRETGVSVIKLDKEVDHGPILNRQKEPIFEDDTAESLYLRLFTLGAKILPQTINKYVKGELRLSEQDHAGATFTKRLTRQDGYLNLCSLEIENCKLKIDRMIKAYYPWPGVWTKLRIKNKELRIKFLPGEKIQVEGGKPMSYKDFINGYPEGKEVLKKLSPY
ncbi:hypothetical protein M1615_01040 [Patescibacteria group bacterium]|nr:hypothetical protein [Patescibacteria group bacterium]MCL5010463.1 hypothetical protein [Patescibacteria group bacterium]